MIRNAIVALTLAIPGLSLAQFSILSATYRLEADARSGSVLGSDWVPSGVVGQAQTFFDRVDARADQLPSTVHSWASVGWNCMPWDMDVELVACWNSTDLGAGNSGHMLSRLNLVFNIAAVNIITANATFDPPNSSMAIDRWTGTSWVLHVSGNQLINYTGIWQPGDYRFRTQRLYNPVGSSTGCVGYGFRMHAEPLVPEPSSSVALVAGLTLLVRRRRQKVTRRGVGR